MSSHASTLAFAAVAAGVTVVLHCMRQRKAEQCASDEPARRPTPSEAAARDTRAASGVAARQGGDVATVCAHAGVGDSYATGDVTPPIHLSSTYERRGDLSYVSSHVYTRCSNPTRSSLERTLAQLEGGKAALTFSSGMAAANAMLQAMPNTHVLLSADAYFGVREILTRIFRPWGGTFELVDVTDLGAVRSALAGDATRGKRVLVWLEIPTNPTLRVCDVAAISALAHERGALVLVDSTWLTPVLCRPFKLGADLVLHSATKYMGGHSDLLAGAVVLAAEPSEAADAAFTQLAFVQASAGAVASPFDCWLCLRGIRTLETRMQRHSASATAIASFLAQHPNVEAVLYPGHESHPQHALAMRQARASGVEEAGEPQFGGMLSVLVRGGQEAAVAAAARLKVFTRATSLGGTESLVEHRRSIEGPETQTPGNLLRLSVGLEAVSDLIRDLDQALRGASA